MTMKGVTPWLRQHSDLIAAVGALVVFTSWAVSSTLGQRYEAEATSIRQRPARGPYNC
jgi:hypothetical protein